MSPAPDQDVIDRLLALVDQDIVLGDAAEIKAAHLRLANLCTNALNQFRYANEVPGVRYWEVYFRDGNEPERMWHTTMLRGADPHALPRDAQIEELNRLEFLARAPRPTEKPPRPEEDDDL